VRKQKVLSLRTKRSVLKASVKAIVRKIILKKFRHAEVDFTYDNEKSN
jgi:hypothetical protein